METLTEVTVIAALLSAAALVLVARTRAHIREYIGDEPLWGARRPEPNELRLRNAAD